MFSLRRQSKFWRLWNKPGAVVPAVEPLQLLRSFENYVLKIPAQNGKIKHKENAGEKV